MSVTYRLPCDTPLRYLPLVYTLSLWVKGIERERGWGPMLDVVREMPCAEDFEPWDTNVRKDFLRKWYHTRSKKVKTVSLEECMEDEDSGIHTVADPAWDFTEQVAGKALGSVSGSAG